MLLKTQLCYNCNNDMTVKHNFKNQTHNYIRYSLKVRPHPMKNSRCSRGFKVKHVTTHLTYIDLHTL